MRIIVTGGAGFIGSHLVDALLEDGHEVSVIDNLISGKKENLNKDADFFEADIKDRSKLEEIFKTTTPEAVIHLAAQKSVSASVSDPIFDATENIIGSLTLLEVCRQFDCDKVIFSSTGGALYGETDNLPTPESQTVAPESPYGIAKYSIENYLRFYGEVYSFKPVILRMANVYGPRQDPKGEAGVVAIFCDKLLSGGQPIIFGDGGQTRDYVYVGDVVNAFVAALKHSKVSTFNIGTGHEVSVLKIFDKLSQEAKAETKPRFERSRPGELRRSCLSSALAKDALGWEPKTTLEDGLRKTFHSFEVSGTIDRK
ncbi:MAG: NAD-dependent epimerase/dehydratase family protein [Patescibacteria group bacterium]